MLDVGRARMGPSLEADDAWTSDPTVPPVRFELTLERF